MGEAGRHAERVRGLVLGVPIDVMTWDDAVTRIMTMGAARTSSYVAICNVHVVVTASRDENYRRVIAGADMATPDGAPVAWTLRRLGFREQPRISGPDLMWSLLGESERTGVSVYFFGSTEHTLSKLQERVRRDFPRLLIAGAESPPFRPDTGALDQDAADRINASGAGLVFVGLGCPKQERWMARHRGTVHAVMLGVGAAFDFHAGVVRRAPMWMQRHGLEWLHRLLSEPRRLWKRYLVTNSLFVMGVVRQLVLGSRSGSR